MKILVTGTAGFIGYHLTKRLSETGHDVVGLDNINDYYDPSLKLARLSELGLDVHDMDDKKTLAQSTRYKNLKFIRISLEDGQQLTNIFAAENFDVVCNLAAQAGVRYSLENPNAYVQSNLVGFMNILEASKNFGVKHLVYASSSSVYGLNKKIPFDVSDRVDEPISIYAATKKANELMAHTYTHLYGLPTTGLRFFTVYGPWGRPDMALFLFVDAIVKGKPIKVFNHGEMERDFTYVDDVVEGLMRIIENKGKKRSLKKDPYKIYNIGNNKSVRLSDFITAIEKELGTTAYKEMLPMQPGDVKKTWANVNELIQDYTYGPNTKIEDGVREFVDWYKDYYGVGQEK